MSKKSLDFKEYLLNELIDPTTGNLGGDYVGVGSYISGETEMTPFGQTLLPSLYMALNSPQLDNSINRFLTSNIKQPKTIGGTINNVNKTKYPTAIAIEFGNEGEWKLENRYYDMIFGSREPTKGQTINLKLANDGRVLSYKVA